MAAPSQRIDHRHENRRGLRSDGTPSLGALGWSLLILLDSAVARLISVVTDEG
jgi:hypothetical protein